MTHDEARNICRLFDALSIRPQSPANHPDFGMIGPMVAKLFPEFKWIYVSHDPMYSWNCDMENGWVCLERDDTPME